MQAQNKELSQQVQALIQRLKIRQEQGREPSTFEEDHSYTKLTLWLRHCMPAGSRGSLSAARCGAPFGALFVSRRAPIGREVPLGEQSLS